MREREEGGGGERGGKGEGKWEQEGKGGYTLSTILPNRQDCRYLRFTRREINDLYSIVTESSKSFKFRSSP